MFRASWPILRPDLKLSVLQVEACEQLDQMAKEERCRIVGEVSWSIEEGRLYARAAAVPRGRRSSHGALESQWRLVAALVAQGLSDQRIADQIGGSRSAIARVRHRHGIPPASPAPVQLQRKGQAA